MIPTNWVTIFLAIMSLALLYWQGWELLGRETYSSRFGVLTISLAALAALLQILFFTGKLVFSYDLHAIMAEGPFVRLGLELFVLGISLAASFGWLIAEADGAIGWTSWLTIIGVGILVGALAIAGIHLLNPDDAKPLRVYSFDLWAPELFLWVTFCLTQSALGRMVGDHEVLRVVLGAAVCCWAISLPQFSELNGVSSWWALFLLGLFLAMLLVGWWTVARAHPTPRVVRVLAYFLVILGATASAGLGLRSLDNYDLLLSVTAGASVLLFLTIVASRVPRGKFSGEALKTSIKDVWKFGRPLYLSRLRWSIKVRKTRFLRHWVLWVVLIGVFGGFFAAPYLASTDPRFRLTGLAVGPGLDSTVGLSGLVFVWVLLIEIFGMGPITANRSEPNQDGAMENVSPAQSLWRSLSARIQASSRWAVGRLTALVVHPFSKIVSGIGLKNAEPRIGNEPANDSEKSQEVKPSIQDKPKLGARAWIGGIAKTLVGVAILIAISEMPNARQTLIGTFHTPKFKEAETEDDVGEAISDEVINSLAGIGKQLRPLVVGLPASGTGATQFRAPSATDTTGGVSEALGKGTSLGLPGGVSVPLNLLLLPIQTPMRWLLGVRVIQGSLYESDQGFTLLASSSNGETWNVSHTGKLIEAAIPDLADSMAFQIAIRDPSFDALGLGKKWDGFKKFELGQASWEAYQAQKDVDKLTYAIKGFREATEIDPDFALAHYRLGLALQEDGDPAGAVTALRASVHANPNFVPGYVALASTLQDFDTFRQATPAVLSNPHLSAEQSWAQRVEARELWQKVATFPSSRLTLSDEASAYYGLCLDNLSLSQKYMNESQIEKSNDVIRLAYFHCRRAEEVIAQFPVSLRDMPLNRQNEASAINAMGLSLTMQLGSFGTTDWICSADSADIGALDAQGRLNESIQVGPLLRAASRYFTLAQTLQPDDQIIACNAALASYGLGDEGPMQRLELSPDAHLSLGDSFDRLAKDKEVPTYYLLAMREYRRATELDPDRIWALNDFAYTFWQFRLAAPYESMPDWLGVAVGRRAEEYARRASFLAPQRLVGWENNAVQLTLGEVLLGQGRTEEAVRELEKLHPPENSMFEEARWDLAQARLCDSSQKRALGKGDPVEEQEAAEALEKIRQSALSRGDETWIDRLSVLDAHEPQPACQADPEGLLPDLRVRYVLRGGKPIYSAATPCAWEGVYATVAVASGTAPSQFRLHVWGAGTNSTISLANTPLESVSLIGERRTTQRVFFAQLLGVQPQDQQPGVGTNVSDVIPIPTYAVAGNGCRQNSILLNFVPSH
ncbi:MAG: hypothetical protein WA510_28825 [Acidobacteriaceae bacterium]